MSDFLRKLDSISATRRSLLCIGLDPDPSLLPVRDVAEFNKAIVDATHDLVCAYKPNLAFYEALGAEGYEALASTIDHIRERAPGAILLGDAKRGDVPSSTARYAKAMFDVWGFDASTVSCYGGEDSLEPYLSYEDRCTFVWCRSSNPGSVDFQDLMLSAVGSRADIPHKALYEWVAARSLDWNERGNVGLVVGATYPDQLALVRARCPQMPILLPGVGAQGGNLEGAVRAGADAAGRKLLVSSSRGVLYASRDPATYAQAARRAAERLREDINRVLDQEGKGWAQT